MLIRVILSYCNGRNCCLFKHKFIQHMCSRRSDMSELEFPGDIFNLEFILIKCNILTYFDDI